jgi:hypothetical protein
MDPPESPGGGQTPASAISGNDAGVPAYFLIWAFSVTINSSRNLVLSGSL